VSRRRAKAWREKTAGVCAAIVERCGHRRITVVDNVESFDDRVEFNRAFRDRGRNPARDQRECSIPFGFPSNLLPAPRADCGATVIPRPKPRNLVFVSSRKDESSHFVRDDQTRGLALRHTLGVGNIRLKQKDSVSVVGPSCARGNVANHLGQRMRKAVAPHQHIRDLLNIEFFRVEDPLQEFANLGMIGCGAPNLLR